MHSWAPGPQARCRPLARGRRVAAGRVARAARCAGHRLQGAARWPPAPGGSGSAVAGFLEGPCKERKVTPSERELEGTFIRCSEVRLHQDFPCLPASSTLYLANEAQVSVLGYVVVCG